MYINRELSWIEFNQRVLSQAIRPDLPLLERLKFLAITASNMDEFFQVRVGGLMLLRQSGKNIKDVAGLSVTEQLRLVRKRCSEMIKTQYSLYNKQLLPLMQAANLRPISLAELTETEHSLLEDYFEERIAPALTPLAVEAEQAPLLPSMGLIVGVELYDEDKECSRFVAVPIPEALSRRIPFPIMGQDGYVLIEDLVLNFVDSFFPGEQVIYKSVFRVTRNGDIILEEEEGGDMAREMAEVLVARKFSDCVRLEIPNETPKPFIDRIAGIVGADKDAIYSVAGPLRLVDFMSMAFEPGNEEHKVKSWKPADAAGVDPTISMFENIAQGDILINNPFESYEPVVRLIEEAAADPNVIAIKQVLYRTSKGSRFVQALCRAAESGKQVTVLIEIKARFDEQRNLEQAEILQRSGVQVVYGVKGFKTHAKALLIIRREAGSLRRYCHFGTGNYNEGTSRIYGDISLLTCDARLGADASQFFNSVMGLTRLSNFRAIYPSPVMMKQHLIELIKAEAARAKLGERAEINAKMNSLNDLAMMEALQDAAEAGVKININIRGVCCWAPSTPKAMANVRIVSIVDCYLEHARIISFYNGGKPLVFLASADWMGRNLDRRVELMVPINDATAAKRALGILDACFKDNTQAFQLMADGSYCPVGMLQQVEKKAKGAKAATSKKFRMQEYLHKQAQSSARASARARHQTLEPHRPRK